MLNNKQLANSPKHQKGVTFIGILFIGGILVFVALIVMTIFPAYTEYFSVKTVIQAMSKESLSTMSKKEIMDSFNRRANTSYVTVVTGKDLTIDKNSTGETVVSVQYQVLKPLAGNISILLDFSASSDKK
ncbi:MAG TPA: DUF4845 domain-containing protein [Methylotenera sp.]|nr:DUF4845 domain-containing protein [Methylotenera sp.]